MKAGIVKGYVIVVLVLFMIFTKKIIQRTVYLDELRHHLRVRKESGYDLWLLVATTNGAHHLVRSDYITLFIQAFSVVLGEVLRFKIDHRHFSVRLN